MKPEKREEARKLRADGCSVKEIASKTGTSVSSVSNWVRDIQLTEEQKVILLDRNPLARRRDGEKWREAQIQTWLKRRESFQDEGRQMARTRDVDFIAGCMLYWAEGTKGKNTVALTNTDSHMLLLFVSFLKRWFDLKDEDFSFKVQWYSSSGNSADDVQRYWCGVLGLPPSCMRKGQIDNISKYSQKKKGNKHPFGTCTVRANRTDVVQKIFGAIQEFAGFENKNWIG
jgi:hypothetical protein